MRNEPEEVVRDHALKGSCTCSGTGLYLGSNEGSGNGVSLKNFSPERVILKFASQNVVRAWKRDWKGMSLETLGPIKRPSQ